LEPKDSNPHSYCDPVSNKVLSDFKLTEISHKREMIQEVTNMCTSNDMYSISQ